MNKLGKKAAFFRLMKYFSRYKRLVAAAIFFAVVGNVLALVAPVLSASAINAIDTQTGIVDMDAVVFYCIAMAVCYLLSSVFTYLLTFTMTKLSRNISRRMREEVFDKLLSLPVSFFDKRLAGDVINRLIYDIDTVNASLSNDIVQISTGVITIVGSLVSMLLLSPLLSCVFIVIIPLTVLVTVQRSRVMRPLFRKRSGKLGELNGYSEEMLSGIRTIKGYGREEEISARYEERNRIAAGAYYDADYYGSKVGPTVNFINNLSTVFISVLGGWLFLQGTMRLGYVSAFLQYSRKFTGPVNEFANIISEIQSALAAAERLFGILDETPEQDAPHTLPAPENVKGDVVFSHVSFGYDPEKPVLRDVSFSAKAGKTVAIVGPTGAGKTTIVNLLMRFYDADKGEILLDGVETRRYSRADLRAQFTMVLQDTWLFEGTVRENIAYGADGATQEEIERAARAAGVHDFILSLPQGYDTRITDGGSSLSKGQKQLLTIARAMVSRARILILDEATSNVDTRTEILVQAATQKLMQGKTCFVIAHRLSTIVGADLILVVRGGNIVESGTHASLLEQGGFYASLYGAQFQ